MRERIKDLGRLKHIQNAIEILSENSLKYDFNTATSDPIIFYGFVKHVEIIGEAVYKLTREFKTEHPEIEWNVIENMRHVLVHGYYQIKPQQLWKTVKEDIPILKDKIDKLISELVD